VFAVDAPQLAGWLDVTRLSLHVLAASVWVGGQLVLAGLVYTVRSFGGDATRRIAGAFGRLTWPAYWLLIATGVWNYLAIDHGAATFSWNVAFAVKMACVVLAGVGSYLHTKASSARSRGIWAGLGTLGAILALVLGVALAG
jgi:putative copper export protein